MREEEIKRLVKIVEESSIGELEISRWGRTIKITKNPPPNSGHHSAPATAQQQPSPPPSSQDTASKEESTQSESKQEKGASGSDKSVEIKSPMVGTFYRAPAPDADSYVEVGQTIKKGQVLCIIEAMKLMNEIESEVDGRVVEILVENAQPVEYNQPLFMIEPA